MDALESVFPAFYDDDGPSFSYDNYDPSDPEQHRVAMAAGARVLSSGEFRALVDAHPNPHGAFDERPRAKDWYTIVDASTP